MTAVADRIGAELEHVGLRVDRRRLSLTDLTAI